MDRRGDKTMNYFAGPGGVVPAMHEVARNEEATHRQPCDEICMQAKTDFLLQAGLTVFVVILVFVASIGVKNLWRKYH